MYKSYLPEVQQQMDKTSLKTLTAIGLFLVGKMKHLVPVRTGRLKSSLTYDANDKELYFGSGSVEGQPVFYATFAEKNRPFIKPSVFNNVQQINEIANKIFREEM